MLYSRFLSYYPLKQGLKLSLISRMPSGSTIFILLSIKTRIETKKIMDAVEAKSIFLSYYPLKQGLKRNCGGGR